MTNTVEEMRSDPSASKMLEFINAFNTNVVAYGDTGQRWSKLQLVAKIKRAMNGKWNYTLHAFVHNKDPDLKALKTNLLAEAVTKADVERASSLKSAFAALTCLLYTSDAADE